MRRAHLLLPLLLPCLALACSAGESADAGAPAPDAGAPEPGVPDAGELDAGVASCPPLGPELDEGQAPPRRGDMAFAFDPGCERLFVFFGDRAEPQMCNSVPSDFAIDGWTYDVRRGRWAEIPAPTDGPQPLPRARGSAVWDPASRRVLLFGGRWRNGTTGNYRFPSDVWAFDPASGRWEELSPDGAEGAPAGRMNTVWVMDADRNRALLHAGGRNAGTAFAVDSDTWAFDLATRAWQRLETAGPSPTPRLFHTGALDRARRRLFVFGGAGADAFTATTFFSDLWYLDLETGAWTEVSTGRSRPDGRIKSAMDHDPARDRLLLFGGHDDGNLGNTNDLWTFDLEALAWSRAIEGDVWNAPPLGFCDFPADFAIIDPASPERRESHLFVVGGERAYLYGGRTDCGLANDTWDLDLGTGIWTERSRSFNGMTCHRSGRTDCGEPGARKCG